MTNGSNAPIAFDNITKRFGDRSVLDGVTFEIPRGEALCIMGRSGTGKSVTLKLTIGLMKPDSGAIRIEGEDITGMDEDQITAVRRKMGFLFQDAALFDSFSLHDNLALPLRRFKTKDESQIKDTVKSVLEEVGLGKDECKMPVELSGGMRKRAGLARALALEPSILLVDEPSSGLDRVTASEIDELLLNVKSKNQTTMIIVTHDIHGARRVGDKLGVLDKGKLVALGTAKELEGHENELVRALVSPGE